MTSFVAAGGRATLRVTGAAGLILHARVSDAVRPELSSHKERVAWYTYEVAVAAFFGGVMNAFPILLLYRSRTTAHLDYCCPFTPSALANITNPSATANTTNTTAAAAAAAAAAAEAAIAAAAADDARCFGYTRLTNGVSTSGMVPSELRNMTLAECLHTGWALSYETRGACSTGPSSVSVSSSAPFSPWNTPNGSSSPSSPSSSSSATSWSQGWPTNTSCVTGNGSGIDAGTWFAYGKCEASVMHIFGVVELHYAAVYPAVAALASALLFLTMLLVGSVAEYGTWRKHLLATAHVLSSIACIALCIGDPVPFLNLHCGLLVVAYVGFHMCSILRTSYLPDLLASHESVITLADSQPSQEGLMQMLARTTANMINRSFLFGYVGQIIVVGVLLVIAAGTEHHQLGLGGSTTDDSGTSSTPLPAPPPPTPSLDTRDGGAALRFLGGLIDLSEASSNQTTTSGDSAGGTTGVQTDIDLTWLHWCTAMCGAWALFLGCACLVYLRRRDGKVIGGGRGHGGGGVKGMVNQCAQSMGETFTTCITMRRLPQLGLLLASSLLFSVGFTSLVAQVTTVAVVEVRIQRCENKRAYSVVYRCCVPLCTLSI